MVQRPTMYVEQPKIAVPYAPMQQDYSSNKQSLNEPNSEKSFDSESDPSEVNQTLIDSKNEDSTEKTVQTFNQMTMEEKLDYLIAPSKRLPAMHCKLTIDQSYYRGKVLAREDDQFVFEERHSRKRHLFNLSEINDLRLIGF